MKSSFSRGCVKSNAAFKFHFKLKLQYKHVPLAMPVGSNIFCLSLLRPLYFFTTSVKNGFK